MQTTHWSRSNTKNSKTNILATCKTAIIIAEITNGVVSQNSKIEAEAKCVLEISVQFQMDLKKAVRKKSFNFNTQCNHVYLVIKFFKK